MIKIRVATLFLLLIYIGCSAGVRADEAPELRVIVNAHNPVNNLDKRFVADVYLKKIKHWPSDGMIEPVDLRVNSAIRRLFSEGVLDRSIMGVKNYWQQLIFSGTDVPPPELRSEQDVIKFVSEHSAAIGYVSNSSLSGETGVKPIDLE